MRDAHGLAAAYGVRVELVSLGDWGTVRVIAEYDPRGPAIRVNAAVQPDADAVERAVAHELYHHREAIGEIARLGDRPSREAAADAFAAQLCGARA
jgi:hypothetical protein